MRINTTEYKLNEDYKVFFDIDTQKFFAVLEDGKESEDFNLAAEAMQWAIENK